MTRLAGANGLIALVAIFTGPVLARSLGPEGRGELSAILTIFALAPVLFDFGLADFVTREGARRATLGAVVGTVIPLALCFSLCAVALALPIARAVGQGSAVVQTYVLVGLLVTPLNVFALMLLAIARGVEQWSFLYQWRLITAVGSGLAIIGLAVAGILTVQSAVIVTMSASLIGTLASLPVLRQVGHWRTDSSLVRPALTFGARSWISMFSTVANQRLDIAVMAAVVSSQELGQYAVAVSLVSLVFAFFGAVNTALLPRVAKEGASAVPRIARMSVLVLVASLGVLCIVSPIAIPLAFGSAFSPAILLVVVLSPGTVFLGLSMVLAGALQGHGRPQDVAGPQLVGLAITLIGLAVLLKPLGALGAALVSDTAYAAVLLGTLRASVRVFGVSARSILLPRVDDLRRLVATLISMAGNGAGRLSTKLRRTDN